VCIVRSRRVQVLSHQSFFLREIGNLLSFSRTPQNIVRIKLFVAKRLCAKSLKGKLPALGATDRIKLNLTILRLYRCYEKMVHLVLVLFS